MAWDDMDMWWMQRPPKSDLPQLATGAFMQGMQMAQQRAEFNATLPLKVAESNAQTAATIAKTDIATREANHQSAEWGAEAAQRPILSAWEAENTRKAFDPLYDGTLLPPPTGLTGDRALEANKKYFDLSLRKEMNDVTKSAAVLKVMDEKDKVDLAMNYGLARDKTNDPEAIAAAKFARANRQSSIITDAFLASNPGANIPTFDVPLKPNGDLDEEKLKTTLSRFRVKPAIPAGMTADTYTVNNPDGTKTTYKSPPQQKAAQTREQFVQENAPKLMEKDPSLSGQEAAFKAGEIFDSSNKTRPELGTDQKYPLTFKEKLQLPKSGGWVQFPEKTKFMGKTYEAGSVQFFGPSKQSSDTESPKAISLPGGGQYNLTTGDPDALKEAESKVEKLTKQLNQMGTSAPSTTKLAVPAGGTGLPPTFYERPTTTAEKKAYDANVKKLADQLKAAEEAVRNLQAK